MLSFDIRKLESHAAVVDGWLTADDPVWTDDDERPSSSLHVTGRLSRAGSDRFYFSGHFSGSINLECRRCLRPVEKQIAEDVHAIFAEPGAVGAEEPDVHLVAPGAPALDLRPAIREEWLLAVPAFAECREECPGFCPRCGADLSDGPCGCTSETDRRWDGLKSLRSHAD
jgi:uncharacterized protein